MLPFPPWKHVSFAVDLRTRVWERGHSPWARRHSQGHEERAGFPESAEHVLSGTFPFLSWWQGRCPPAALMCTRGRGYCWGSCLAAAVGCGFYRGASLCVEDPCLQPLPSFPCTVADCHHRSCRRAVRLSCDFPWAWGIDLWLCLAEGKVCSAQRIAWGARSCAPALERGQIWSPRSGHAAVTLLVGQPGSWHEALGVPWWFMPGIWMPLAVSPLPMGPQ